LITEGRKVKEIPSKREKKKQNKTIDKTRQDKKERKKEAFSRS